MRENYFRYRADYQIPAKWQEYIYCCGRLCNDSEEIAKAVNAVCEKAVPEKYREAIMRCAAGGLSPRRASYIFDDISEVVIARWLRVYYREFYIELKERANE